MIRPMIDAYARKNVRLLGRIEFVGTRLAYIALHFTRVARQTFYLFSLRGRLANGGGIGAAEDFMAATIASKFIGSRARG